MNTIPTSYEYTKKIYSKNLNYNILPEIINDLIKIRDDTKDNLIIKRLGDIINKISGIINESKKNAELIRNDISKLNKEINKNFDELKNNNKKQQKLECENGQYIGEVVDGVREGRGIYYLTKGPYKGDKYEGEWKNDKRDGKGIDIFHNGAKYEGDYKNGKFDGKGILIFPNGDRYEGDFKDDKQEGKGIYYYKNGDREMGDYFDGRKIGKHVLLTNKGEVKINKFKYNLFEGF